MDGIQTWFLGQKEGRERGKEGGREREGWREGRRCCATTVASTKAAQPMYIHVHMYIHVQYLREGGGDMYYTAGDWGSNLEDSSSDYHVDVQCRVHVGEMCG